MPEDLSGLTFLDVGCWSGGFCKVAEEKGAKKAVGIDPIRSERMHDFNFIQCDIFSEKFLELEMFDVVLCKGVLYHVENPISLLFRLKCKTRKILFLETAMMAEDDGRPLMEFWADNNTNWWKPNVECVKQMLKTCGFKDIEVLGASQKIQHVHGDIRRGTFKSVPKNVTCQRMYPRALKYL
jgi:tRNA (mo5U34)-methyltransferase